MSNRPGLPRSSYSIPRHRRTLIDTFLTCDDEDRAARLLQTYEQLWDRGRGRQLSEGVRELAHNLLIGATVVMDAAAVRPKPGPTTNRDLDTSDLGKALRWAGITRWDLEMVWEDDTKRQVRVTRKIAARV